MKLLHTTKKPFHKKKRFNPHTLWTACCIGFVILVILELCYFSWYFMQTTVALDAPATPSLETNGAKIQSMQKILDETESALHDRAGVVFPESN